MARTWGQIRQLLAQRFPELSMDQLTSAIQSAYNSILDRQKWSQLHRTGTLLTVERVSVTVTLVKGSATVTGTGFVDDYEGRKFRLTSLGPTYTISAYVSATELTLDRVYEGENATDAEAYIFQNVYNLPLDCKALRRAKNLYEERELDHVTTADLDGISVNREEFGEPIKWANYDPVEEGTAALTLQRIELYPIPIYARGLPIEYDGAVFAFDGTNARSYPVPWVSEDAIEYLASAKCCMEPQVQKDPTPWRTEAEVFIKRMVTADAARTGPIRLNASRSMTLADRKRLSR